MPMMILILLLIFLQPLPVPAAETLTPVTVQLKWFHQFQFAGFYAAIDQGYYRDSGLEVTLREGNPSINFTEAVVSGEADFGINNTDLIIHRSRGAPVVLLAPVFQHTPQRLAVRGDLEVYTPHALAGKKVMLSRDGETELLAMLRAEGVTLEKLIPVPHSWDITDLINGNVDAMSIYLTSEVYTLQKLNASFNLLQPENYGIDFYGDIIFTTDKMVKEQPDLVNRFIEATLKGWEYALRNKGEMISLIQNTYGYEGERERLLYEAETIGTLMAESIVEIGHSNRYRWEKIVSTYEELGMLEQPVVLDELLYDPELILTRSKMRMLQLAAAILVVALIIGIALLAFNLRLQNEVKKQTGELAQLNSVLGSALREKDLLLREIHHRVKNNLQIIGSLIHLQHSNDQDPAVSAVGHKSLQRIQSMALIHEHLYNSDHLDQVDLGEYLGELIRLVDQGSHSVHSSLVLDIDSEPIMSSIDTAVPLGLLAVELYTNALKHAVDPEKPSPVRVGLHCRDRQCTLCVRDRGPGLDPSVFHGHSSKSLGLTLVKTLASQIGADISVSSDEGTEICVSFPQNINK